MVLYLQTGGASGKGPYRSKNEDAAVASSSVVAVADGIGGGPAGDYASRHVIRRIGADHSALYDASDVTQVISRANQDLLAIAQEDSSRAGMATTLTALFVIGSGLLLAHAGDSRAYRVRDGVFERMSRDDSYVQELLDAGLIDTDGAEVHPHRNVVTASLRGQESDLEAITLLESTPQPSERWLLCSDGVSSYVPEALLHELLSDDGDPRRVAQAIVGTALAAGSKDNVTAVIAQICEGAEPLGEQSPQTTMSFFGAASGAALLGLE